MYIYIYIYISKIVLVIYKTYMDRENTNAKLMILVNKELKRDEVGRKPFLSVG